MGKIKFTNDHLADSLTRIRNSILSNKETVVLPNTKLVLELLKVLSNSGFIGSYEVNENEDVIVTLKVNGSYKISELVRVSKPGLRKYISSDEIQLVKGGRGISVISTSKGVMSGREARKEHIGGELLCNIW